MNTRKQIANTKHSGESKFLWILDNGHGSDTPGKRSPRLPDGRQFHEYRFNREITGQIAASLEQRNIKHHRLVPEDQDIPIEERIRRANNLAKTNICVLVAVHSNAYGDGSRFSVPRGIVTFYWRSSYAGKRIAELFQENLIQITGWRDRGIRHGNFAIIRETTMPAIITENGFYTNREQLEYLLDPAWRTRIAEAHVEAITEIEAKGPKFFTDEN